MWQKKNDALWAVFTFKDFKSAFAFMTEIALIAEKMDHHPDWTNCWNRVEIRLSTHEAGNIITAKDERLAKAIEAVYVKYETI